MKSIQYLLVAICLFTTAFSFSQEISIDKNAWGYEFKKGEQELTWRELLQETSSVEESYDLIKRAQSQTILSSIFGFAGGALVGIPVGQALGNGEPNWVLAIAGGALITVAIPLASRSKRNLEEGVALYNARSKTAFLRELKPEVSLLGNANGLGLRLRF